MTKQRRDELKVLIAAGNVTEAILMVKEPANYHEAEEFVDTIFKEDTDSAELIDAALEGFVSTRENTYELHGYWVHSLSHFTHFLWQRRLLAWIKRLNEIAFLGAKELWNFNCSDRLVNDFGKHSDWNDDPVDFHITSENMSRWMDWKHYEYARIRIEKGVFETEEAFIRWQLSQSENHLHPWIAHLIDVNKIQKLLRRLRELGADTFDVDDLPRNLLIAKLGELRWQVTGTTPNDHERKQIEHAIESNEKALVSLSE